MSTHDRRNRRRRRLGLVGVGAGDGGGLDGFVLPQRGDLFGWSAWDASTGGAITRTNASAALGMGYVIQGTGQINDSHSYAMLLDGGTYRFDLIITTNSSRGIITLLLDGVSIGTIDGYTAGAVNNTVFSITGVSVTAGRHSITLLTTTKNASSSGYYMSDQSITATRTGV